MTWPQQLVVLESYYGEGLASRALFSQVSEALAMYTSISAPDAIREMTSAGGKVDAKFFVAALEARFRQHLHALRIASAQGCAVLMEGSLFSEMRRMSSAREEGVLAEQARVCLLLQSCATDYADLARLGTRMINQLPPPHVVILLQQDGFKSRISSKSVMSSASSAIESWMDSAGLAKACSTTVHLRRADDERVVRKIRDAVLCAPPSSGGTTPWARQLSPPSETAQERIIQDLVGCMAHPTLSLAATAAIVSGDETMKFGRMSPASPAGVLDLMQDG